MAPTKDAEIGGFPGAFERQEPMQIIDTGKDVIVEFEQNIASHKTGTRG